MTSDLATSARDLRVAGTNLRVRDPVSAAEFREIMASFPTGVTVVTTVSGDGAPVGLTANAVSSVSIAPPQLLICLGKDRFTAKAIETHRAFAVNFLDWRQYEIAQRFASSAPDKFADIEFRAGSRGLPLLTGALAHAECELERAVDAGDHLIFIGLVLRGEARAGDPLIFFRRSYASWSGRSPGSGSAAQEEARR
jgi:flavin reductase (DIM6/NTAB) family NADH-FMN oxidoreductase RutF